MATHIDDIDAENQDITTSNEQTPLLNDHQSIEEPRHDEIRLDKKKTSWYVWRVMWAILVALVLAVFIKGWIDAGADVDVNCHYFTISAINILIKIS